MDSTFEIHNNASSDEAVTLALDNLSLAEISSNESLGLQKESATEATLNIRADRNCSETRKTKPLATAQNNLKAQDCALTILDDSCSLTNNELSLNSTYVVPEGKVNSLRDSTNDKMKIDFVMRQNSQSNSRQKSNSLDCVITLFESSESESSNYDSDSSYDSESADRLEYNNENELSYTIKRKSLSSGGESTEESSSDSDDSSDSHEDSNDSHKISNEWGEDSDDDSSDSDSVSIIDDSDEELTSSDAETAEDSDEDTSTTREEKPDSDEKSDPCNDNGSTPIESSEDEESSDDDKPDNLDESSESSSESSDDSD